LVLNTSKSKFQVPEKTALQKYLFLREQTRLSHPLQFQFHKNRWVKVGNEPQEHWCVLVPSTPLFFAPIPFGTRLPPVGLEARYLPSLPFHSKRPKTHTYHYTDIHLPLHSYLFLTCLWDVLFSNLTWFIKKPSNHIIQLSLVHIR